MLRLSDPFMPQSLPDWEHELFLLRQRRVLFGEPTLKSILLFSQT